MRITCPHCGERALDEFTYSGDATVRRPDPKAVDALETFTAYAYARNNPPGAHCELWYHAMGCHAWLVVTRDTRTHVISDVATAQAHPRAEAES